jgi:hypothetical protein
MGGRLRRSSGGWGWLLAIAAVGAPLSPAHAQLSVTGRWLAPQAWPVIPIHAALLPTGKVLQYSYPEGGPTSAAFLWNPADGSFTSKFVDTNIFCSGLTFLENGRLFMTGGTDPEGCQFTGIRETHFFDPTTESFVNHADMSIERWYPTNLTLPDGSVLIVSGLDITCNTTPIMERFFPSSGLEVVPEGERYLSLYPNLHVLPNGKVAHIGPEPDTYTWDPTARVWEYVTTNHYGGRYGSPSVMLAGRPNELMIMGGTFGQDATNSCEIIDFGDPSPSWRYTNPMHDRRIYSNAVTLPDGTVFVMGGSRFDLRDDPVLTSELFDPMNETWTLMPSHVYPRAYHATALLLPDARVLLCGDDGWDGAYRGEIYEPGYLFRGARPALEHAPSSIGYGSFFGVRTPDAGAIVAVSLVAMSAVTHARDTPQRVLFLPFAAIAGNEIAVAAPSSGTFAPPGHYMLFLLNGLGVPSMGGILHVGPSVVSVDTGAPAPKASWVQAATNPILRSGEIEFAMAAAGHVRLEVIDAAGRGVRQLVSRTESRGTHRVSWDGRDEAGHVVSSGKYFYVLTTVRERSVSGVVVVR